MSERRVLVTGGTGTVGSAVIDSLAERGDVAVRAGTRDPAAARERFVIDPSFNGDVEFVRFDFKKPETWGRAFEGVSGLFLVPPPGGSADRVLGRPPRSLRTFVADYRERFEPPDSSATDADPRSKVSGDR